MKSGSIHIGTTEAGEAAFEVDEQGNLTARRGTFQGHVVATSGSFYGTVQASDFLDKNGVSMLTQGKFKSQYLDLGGIQIDGETGNINFSEVGSITWGKYQPNGIEETVVTYAVSSSGTTPPTTGWRSSVPTVSQGQYLWSKTTVTYTDGTTSDSYIVGYHGRNGQTPTLPSYIKETYIDHAEIRSPIIKANDYYIYPNNENDIDGTFNIFGMLNGVQYHMFQIAYYGGIPPTIRLTSPDDGFIYIGKPVKGVTHIEGSLLDLQGVTKIEWGHNAPNAVWA